MECVHGKNKSNPTYDAMIVHKESYFKKVREDKERVCFNCRHWIKINIAIGECVNKSSFSDFKGERTWYTHSCKLCHVEVDIK